MKPLGLTLDELTQVMGTCSSIEIETCTPPYLRDVIVVRLAGPFPVLAAKVRASCDEQLDALCHHTRATFSLVRGHTLPSGN